MEEEDSSFKLCVPVPLQSPLHKTFRPIETVGKWGAPPPLPTRSRQSRFLWAHGCDASSDHQVVP